MKNRKKRGRFDPIWANAKEANSLARDYANAINAINRLVMGVDSPKKYLDASVALGALYALPTVLDVFLGDFERISVDTRLKTERQLYRLMKDAQTAIERLLNHVYKTEVASFTQSTGGDEELAKYWANEQCDLSCTFVRILKFLFTYCCDEGDKWRVTQLMQTLDKLTSDEAQADKLKQVRERCQMHLQRLGIKDVEAAKERVAQMRKELDLIRTAASTGQRIELKPKE